MEIAVEGMSYEMCIVMNQFQATVKDLTYEGCLKTKSKSKHKYCILFRFASLCILLMYFVEFFKNPGLTCNRLL